MYQIHYTHHNFGSWAIATYHMSHQQKGIFDTLKMLYFGNASKHNGKLDASDFDLLCRQAGCYSESEIADLRLLLQEQFKKIGNNYRRASWDKEISDIVWEIGKNNGSNGRNANRNGKSNDTVTQSVTDSNTVNHTAPMSEAERQARHRDKQKILKALSNKGVTVPKSMNYDELVAFYHAHFSSHDNATVTQSVTDSNETDNESNAQKGRNTINHNHNHNQDNNISPQPQGACVGVGENEASDETNQMQTTKTHPPSDTHKTLNVSFETFWDAYDKKIDPKKCRPLWERLSDQDRTDIMAYIPKYKQAQPDKQYRKNPQTFLNARSWESEIVSSQPTKSSDKFYGTPADPLAVNQHWQNYELPAHCEENLARLLAEQAILVSQNANQTTPKAPMGFVEI